ncbi:MAG: AI-2E family transporter [Candidatus Eremiobacteraeota bacterium]|nr:AI-2E family transporter [Candidatus Eremiobacteraeota bacterium]
MLPERQLFRGQDRVRYALEILGVIALAGLIFSNVLNFIGHIQTVAVIVIGALFFTYLIYPAVERLHRRLPLGASIAIVYVAFAAIVAFGASVIVPALSGNIKDFISSAPTLANHAEASLADPNNPLIERLPASAQAYLTKLPANLTELATRYGAETASRTLVILLSTVSFVALFIVIPVVAAYMLMEAEALKKTFVGMISPGARPRTLKIISDLDKVIGGFIRGQLIVAATVGALITILLLVLHVQYAVLIGIAAGILDVIPYVGALAGWLPAFFIALFANGWQNALFVTAGFVVINQLEGHIIAPNVVSKSVELTPLVVVIALITGGELLGIPGLLIAVPVAGIIRVVIMNFRPPKQLTDDEINLKRLEPIPPSVRK